LADQPLEDVRYLQFNLPQVWQHIAIGAWQNWQGTILVYFQADISKHDVSVRQWYCL
jgi:hypothetical protein